MSWKGFKKALERMPHQLQNKIGRGTKTVDTEYDDLKLRFIDLETVAKTLFLQAAQFRDSIRATLVYQIAFLEQILASYRPITTDPEGVAQPMGSYIDEGASPELLRVAEEFRSRVTAIKTSVDPQLETLDMSVVGPVQEMLAMMKNVRRVMQKRDHKMVDFDRYRAQVEKHEAKEGLEGQRSLPDQQSYEKYSAQYQEASRQYNYYNDMLKAELSQLLDLRQAFMDPVFLKFFRIQHQLYTQLLVEMSAAARNCPAFDLTTPVVVGWQQKWPRAEQTMGSIDLWSQGFMHVEPYKLGEKPKGFVGSLKGTFRKKEKSATPTASSMFAGGAPAYGSSPPPAGTSTGRDSPYSSHSGNAPPPNEKPQGWGGGPSPYASPAYQAPPGEKLPAAGAAASPSHMPPPAYDSLAAPNPYAQAPPPEKAPPASMQLPVPRPGPRPQFVVAIYDYAAQAEGDLSFREGDRIELVQRTAAKDDWWTGRLNGVTGVFPGTYVTDP
ncbi:hypothetical protein DL89DRAFT_224241 [Linderina pennispora]|uniref:BAR-domain-containing protein n=1 Tax=Linderina pennispora TaxID=61395 RepID=A0A1Y1W713_9FUNG|nr:uncharacterized protein DL89DRAFT_224241 [Linderina pennispora]ORX69311.1 hypothetical protein DL89DRAFT_224241 [Linderina pennispora]